MTRALLSALLMISGLVVTGMLISGNHETPRPAGNLMYGVTLDSIEDLPAIVDSLASLAVKPTVRIVFDEWVAAREYRNAATRLRAVSHIMGGLLDSYCVRDYSVKQYEARAQEYLETLGNQVDIWEIGNEVNGEWLGRPEQVVAKIEAVYRVVNRHGGRTALTLYYNEACWKYPREAMFAWVKDRLPEDIRHGLDYVFISYYEEDCNGLRPDWETVFPELARLFPHSRIGFGETGVTNEKEKAAYLQRYYNPGINHPRFIGGYFWWYYHQDMVPKNKPLWKVLNKALQRGNP